MFRYILKHRTRDGSCDIFVRDSCFTKEFRDTWCPCLYPGCYYTGIHLIKLYEQKGLNVGKNLAAYYMHLHTKHGIVNARAECDAHMIRIGRSHPELSSLLRYHNSIVQYLKSNMFRR